MSNYSLEIVPTTRPNIYKFEANSFLVNHKNYEFKNIDDAKKSPLAQKLFYFPFVKTVFLAQNFVAIEKYDIAEWTDIKDELKNTIEELLNSGVKIIEEGEDKKGNIPVTVYAESTPNPKTMKFVANKKLVLQSSEYKSIDDAKNSPLAQKLFHFPFVKEIFIDENYISISKYDIAEWEDITLELREFIRNYIQEGNEVVKTGQNSATTKETQPEVTAQKNLDDTSKEIIAILDEYVKPAVASDGGNILFDSYNEETKTVKVILQGACSGCPSSTFTLKNGIENMLKEMLHNKVNTVEAING
ncbi:NifU family protein [Mesonia sp. K7]|uniref:NifU family protein n=1 Tax=Mesonia sp. K7 TaxID=2218606 RepID=UPI000DA8602F|nr:NifU family protein [Mesonia sp. K7]PZD78743.1 NifU family protein [Mesonia sp. K7]